MPGWLRSGTAPRRPFPPTTASCSPRASYRTPELTLDQQRATAVDAGFAEADVDAFLDSVVGETVVLGIRIADGGWTQLASVDGAADIVGWRGTYEVVDDDTVIATDSCGAITYTYSLDGDQLTLDMVDDQCAVDGVTEQIVQTIFNETSAFTLESPAGSEATVEAPATYASTTFAVPFDVTLPEWVLPEPTAEEPNFVTWEGSDVDRAIRFLAPISVYPPAVDDLGDAKRACPTTI